MNSKFEQLRNFTSLNPSTFCALTKKLGLESAACYQLKDKKLLKIISSKEDTENSWPIIADYTPNYTTFGGIDPLGWTKGTFDVSQCNDWPKGTNFYFPEQELYAEKLVFTYQNFLGKRSKFGELNATLEIMAARIRFWTSHQKELASISEQGFQESIKAFTMDIQSLVNHDLRTPLASISGYNHLLQSLDPKKDAAEWSDYCHIINEQTNCALEALDKLSYGITSSDNETSQVFKPCRFDAHQKIEEVCNRVRMETTSVIISEKANHEIKINLHKKTDHDCLINADSRLFSWAIWEVIKNAVIHSKNSEIDVELYHSDNLLVIDITDDGQGISDGADELIFLRFYQEPKTLASRKGKRGLGLGLFLARHIAERHLGQLSLVRRPEKGTVFRFIWPIEKTEKVSNSLLKGA